MASSEWQTYWDTMQAGCEKILRYTQELDRAAFERDEKTFEAVLYNLQLIHEAAKSLPEDIHPRLGEEQWRRVAGFKGAVSNACFGTDQAELWGIVQEQIPELLEALQRPAKEAAEIRRSADPQRRDRGRTAEHPSEIPPPGWRDIGWRVWDKIFQDDLFLLAAGVAFYYLLAIFPALAVIVSIYGMIANPADVHQQLTVLGGALPPDAWRVLADQLQTLTQHPNTTLSIGALVSLLLALWSAKAGIGALMSALNRVYYEQEKRGIVHWHSLALALTVGAIVFLVVALVAIVVVPVLLESIGFREGVQILLAVLRWPLLAVGVMLGLAVIYRYGPSRNEARWEWVSWGSVAATVLWVIGSMLFSVYVANFGAYNETYGSVGAVVILMLWFWLTALIILLGAELNAEMEHQTRKDTTTGEPKPMGKRNAYVADTVGKRP